MSRRGLIHLKIRKTSQRLKRMVPHEKARDHGIISAHKISPSGTQVKRLKFINEADQNYIEGLTLSQSQRRTDMAKRNYKPEEIVSKLRQADVLIAQGSKIPDVVRTLGVTQVTYYRWRREFGGLQTDQVKRMKDLELENQCLRRAVSDLTLDKLILAEAARGNF